MSMKMAQRWYGEGNDPASLKDIKQIYTYGFDAEVVESAKYGVRVICYNFIPIFDWTRTDLFRPRWDSRSID